MTTWQNWPVIQCPGEPCIPLDHHHRTRPDGVEVCFSGPAKKGFLCHCGEPVTVADDGLERGMCQDCDTVRCDAYPGACR